MELISVEERADGSVVRFYIDDEGREIRRVFSAEEKEAKEKLKMFADGLRNIVIGRLLDNMTEVIEIDIGAWRKRYPALTRYHLEVIAPDGTEYLPAVTMDGDILRWVVTGSDTAHAGRGSWKVVGEGTDGERKSSDTMLFTVRNSMAGFAAENSHAPMTPYARGADGKEVNGG